MTTPDVPTTRPTATDPALREALMELLALGVRISRVMAEMVEIEGRVVASVAAALPPTIADPGSLPAAQAAGLAVDDAAAQLAESLPRIATASRSFDRVARAVRRTAALVQRMDSGWPRRGGPDDRQAMARRQVSRSVGETIARHAHSDAAERLFDDLNDRLDAMALDGALIDQPVEAVIAAICRDLGLPAPAVEPVLLPRRQAAAPDG